MANENAYGQVIEAIFFAHYNDGDTVVEFEREELRTMAETLGLAPAKNLGDVVYSFRYRRDLPAKIRETCPEGEEWIIRSGGTARYRFERLPAFRIEPQTGLYRIKVPDATPEIVAKYALTDEQALLAKIRYNRLIDIFTGITTYSLQSHLRTQVAGVQIEIDELYLGVGKTGAQYILPVQAKGGGDRLGRVQIEQDHAFCSERYPELVWRPVAAQFMADGVIAMFELTIADGQIQILEERHYLLVPAADITKDDLDVMRGAGHPPE